jgi:hypothetical protein
MQKTTTHVSPSKSEQASTQFLDRPRRREAGFTEMKEQAVLREE